MKKMIGFVLAGVMALSLAACGSGTTTASQAAPSSTPAASAVGTSVKEVETSAAKPSFETVKLRVAYMPNLGSASAVTTAFEKGYFKELGLDVELLTFQGGPAEIAAMASGDIQISQIGHGAHALCIEGKAVVFGMDQLTISDKLLANKEKGINTVADLKGKTVATFSGTSADVVLDLLLAKGGLTRDDISVVQMDDKAVVTAMISGQIDACATWAPATTQIEEQMGDKCNVLGTNAEFTDKVSFPGSFITTAAYAKEHEDVLVRFGAAILKAQDFRNANIEDAAKIAAKVAAADEAMMLKSTKDAVWSSGAQIIGFEKDGQIKKIYQSQQDVFIQTGRIKEKVALDQYILFDVMNKAATLYEQFK